RQRAFGRHRPRDIGHRLTQHGGITDYFHHIVSPRQAAARFFLVSDLRKANRRKNLGRGCNEIFGGEPPLAIRAIGKTHIKRSRPATSRKRALSKRERPALTPQ